NNSKNLRLPINFEWANYDKATNHHIQIAKDINFTEIVAEDSTISENKYLVDKLDSYSRYFWRVCYKANGYKGLWSETFSFTTNIGSASLIYPPKDTTNMPLSFIFQWKPVPGAEYYEFLLSLDSNFTKDIIMSSDQITSTQLLVQNLDYNTTYYWKVRGKSQESIGDWSEIWKFTTLEKQQSQVLEEVYGISINPNPTNGLLNVSLVKNSALLKSIKITNLLGETVYKCNLPFNNSETLVLDLTNLEKGIFFIIFEFDNNFTFRNFILLR
ncbi:MAG: T9SS type A sorting domain-containing protein, partial [Candidatus Kapaibacteriota bacterium]